MLHSRSISTTQEFQQEGQVLQLQDIQLLPQQDSQRTENGENSRTLIDNGSEYVIGVTASLSGDNARLILSSPPDPTIFLNNNRRVNERYTQSLEYSEDQPLPLFNNKLALNMIDASLTPSKVPNLLIIEGDEASASDWTATMIDNNNNQTDIINDQNQQDNYMEERSTGEEIIESCPAVVLLSQECQEDGEQIMVDEKKKLSFYVYGGNYPETVVDALNARGNWKECAETESIEKSNFLWRPFNFPSESYKKIDKTVSLRNQSNPFIYNHFEVLKGLTTKSGLVRSLKHYYGNSDLAKQAGYTTFDSSPTTFLLISGQEDQEWAEFNQRYKDIQRGYAPKERIPIKHCVNNIWLVKPSNANQGRGIEIFSDLEELQNFVTSRPQFTCCVVQKYIERPLLFKNRKFDIRVWALFTCKNEVFMYKHGYLRTSSDDYNLTNGNNYVHLTNNCLQKFGDKYGIHEDGNTIGFEAFQKYLDENFPQYNLSVQTHFIPRMKDLIIDTFNASKGQLNPNKRKNCFEFLGYDFLIDEDFRLWVIEVNTNPYFGVPNVFIADLLPKMMDDLLELVVDPTYPPLIKQQRTRPNDFELIYNDNQTNQVNQRRPFTVSLYPVPDLAQQVGPKAARQDLKYLKQYKIHNLQLSTYNFKKQKEQGKSTMRRTTTNSEMETKRSRSVMQLIQSKSKEKAAVQSQLNSPNKKTIIQVAAESSLINNGEGISRQSSKQRFSTGNASHGGGTAFTRSNTVSKKHYQSKLTSQNAKLISKITQSSISRASPPPSFSNNNNNSANSHIKLKNLLNGKSSQPSTPEKSPCTINLPINADMLPVQTVESNQFIEATEEKRGTFNLLQQQRDIAQRQNSRAANERSKSKTRDTSNQRQRNATATNNTRRNDKSIENNNRGVRGAAVVEYEKYSTIVQQQAFEDLFVQMITQIAKDQADDLRTKDNLNMFKKIIETNKHEVQKNERYILDIIRLAVQDNQNYFISKNLFEIIEDYQEKIHLKQQLSRNITLQRQMLNFYLTSKHAEIKQSLLNFLIALSCIDEPSRTKQINKNETPKKRDVSDAGGHYGQGRFASSPYSIVARPTSSKQQVPQLENANLSTIRLGIFNRSLQNGMILFLLNDTRKNNQEQSKLIKLLQLEDKVTLINQLKSISNQEEQTKRPPPPEVRIDIVTSPDIKMKSHKVVEDHLDQEISLIDLSKPDNKTLTKGESLLAFIKSLLVQDSAHLIQLLQQSMKTETVPNQDTRNLNNNTTQDINTSNSLFSPPPSKSVNRKPKMLKSFLGGTPEGPQAPQADHQKQSHKSPFTTAIKVKHTPQQTSAKQKKQKEKKNSPLGLSASKKVSKVSFIKHQGIVQQKHSTIIGDQQQSQPMMKQKFNEATVTNKKQLKSNSKFKPVLLKSKANTSGTLIQQNLIQGQNLRKSNYGQASMISIATNGQDLRRKSQIRNSAQTNISRKTNYLNQSQTRQEEAKIGKKRTETQLSSYKRGITVKQELNDLSSGSASYYLDASRTQFKKGDRLRGKLSEAPSTEHIPMGNLQRAVLDQQMSIIDEKLHQVQSSCFEKVKNQKKELAHRMLYLPFSSKDQTQQPIEQVSQVSHGGDTGENYLSDSKQEFKMYQTLQNEEKEESHRHKNGITIETEEKFDYMPRLRHETLIVTQSAKNGFPKKNSSYKEDRPLQRSTINFHSKRQSMDSNIRMMKGKEIQEQHQQIQMLRPYIDDEFI